MSQTSNLAREGPFLVVVLPIMITRTQIPPFLVVMVLPIMNTRTQIPPFLVVVLLNHLIIMMWPFLLCHMRRCGQFEGAHLISIWAQAILEAFIKGVPWLGDFS